MSWVKPATVAATALISAVVIGYAAFSKWRQTRNTPNQGYTYAHPREKKKRQCGICLKELNSSEQVTLPCGHWFCRKCLTPLYFGTQTTCCDCRKELNPYDLKLLKRRLLN